MRVFVTKGLIAGLLVLGIGVALDAQRQRASPHETVSATVDGATVSVVYGRPYVKGQRQSSRPMACSRLARSGGRAPIRRPSSRPTRT